MERHAHYAFVGFMALLLLSGLIIFGVWLAHVEFSKEYDTYNIVFNGSVDGLSTGGEVRFNGLKVGEVTKVGIDRADPKRVIAQARVTSDVPIRRDSVASLEPQGITGVNYVQITAGSLSQPLLKDTVPAGVIPTLQSRPSAISSLLQGGGSVLQASLDALNRVNRVLSDDNIKAFSDSIQNVRDITAEVRARKALLADADVTLKNIQQTSDSIRQLSDSSRELVNGDGKRAVHDIADAAEQIKAAGTDARAMIGKLQGPTENFADNGLPQLTSAMVTLQQTAETLNRLAVELEQNPQALVTKSPAKEAQVKP